MIDEKIMPVPRDAAIEPDDYLDKLPAGYETRRLGVWQMVFGEETSTSLWSIPGRKSFKVFNDAVRALPYTRRFGLDIVQLGPFLFVSIFLIGIVAGSIPTANLYMTNWILSTIESGISSGKMDVRTIQLALAGRLIVDMISSVLWRFNRILGLKMESRISRLFEYRFMQATLAKPYSEFDDSDSNTRNRTHEILETYRELHRFFDNIVAITTSLSFLLQLGRENNVGLSFIFLSLLRTMPIFEPKSSVWMRGTVFWAINPFYLRITAMRNIVKKKEFRQEIVSANLESYIINAYSKARNALGDTPIRSAREALTSAENSIFDGILTSLIDDWPTLYYASYALRGSVPFRFSTISSLQLASMELRWRIQYIFGFNSGSLSQIFLTIKEIYQELEVKPDPTAKGLSYPSMNTDERGMALELRSVTFAYPGSKSAQPAIQEVSCSIGAGQLVVIVGANGSGKTSLVKLLTRLHDPTSGETLVDGESAGAYRVKDLRQSTALLSQDHRIFPLSVAENIGIGWPDNVSDRPSIEEAAKKGGAHRFISKLTKGYDTILSNLDTKGMRYVPPSHPLSKFHDKLEKPTDVSGGERQRLVASRTFMRIACGNMKLVVVDEPSAAMDPTGEYELFQHLREARNGKTMIFITHRFGHLTKHADLILCMKEGKLVEAGTHQELIKTKGEYYELYNVQAQAFTS